MISSLLSAILSFAFVLTSDSTPPLAIEGDARVMDNNTFVILAPPMEVHSEGGLMYIVDNQAREVYIQTNAGIDFSQVPDLLDGRRKLSGSYTDKASGVKYKYSLTGIQTSEGEIEPFKADELPEDWIITDLR